MRETIRTEYHLDINEANACESVAVDFLIRESVVLRLTENGMSRGEVETFLLRFGDDLVRTVRSHNRYPEISQYPFGPFTHHYFRLSPPLRNVLLQRGIFWLEESALGEGMEDPVFYGAPNEGDTLIGSVISHERMADLYLTDSEFATLSSAGLRVYGQ